MSEHQTLVALVKPLGRRGTVALQLIGTILTVHRRSWIADKKLFLPVEWLEIIRDTRRDIRDLWHALLAALVLVLLSLPLSLLLVYYEAWTRWEVVLFIGLALLWVATASIALRFSRRFARARPAITLQLKGDLRFFRLRFHRPTPRDPILESVIQRIEKLCRHSDDFVRYPIRIVHEWRRIFPYRIAFVQGVFLTLCLTFLLLIADIFLYPALGMAQIAFLHGLALLPAPVSLAVLFLRRHVLHMQPAAYRAAERAYLQGDIETALYKLNELLHADPHHIPAQILRIQAYTESGSFDLALQDCQTLSGENPALAKNLQEKIWAIRRIYERMHEPDIPTS
jgi:hypothetical protein